MRGSILLSIGLIGQVSAQDGLVSLIQSQPDLSTLLGALGLIPDFASALAASTNITILAPTNEAFANIPANTQESVSIMMKDPDGVSALIAYHVLNGTYPSSGITDVPHYIPTFFNSSYAIGGTVRTNVTGGQNVGLVRNGNDFNVLSGELQTEAIIQADIVVGGITVHKINNVLTIPLNLSDSGSRLLQTAATGALAQADLVTNYDIVDDLTFFIPNNEAFQAAASALQGANLETLRAVLNYHAITGSVIFSPSITNTTAQSVQGGELTFTVIDGAVFVDSARVVTANILLSNGIAHLIDTVLNPNASPFNRSSLDPSASPSPAFPSATSLSEVPFTNAAPSVFSTINVPTIATTVAAVSTSASTSGSSQYTGGAMPTARPVQAILGAGAILAGVFFVHG